MNIRLIQRAIAMRLRRFKRQESGQVIFLTALMLTALFGLAGLVLDAGHSYYSFRKLQASTNASALAGASSLTCPPSQVCSSNAGANAALAYSAVGANWNADSSLPNVAMVSGYPKQLCLTSLQSQGMACMAPTYANAVQVRQTIALPLIFASFFGKKTITLTAIATSAMRGASPAPYNVAIIMDGTLSMTQQDTNCGNTQMNCALAGVRILLQSLTPCALNQGTCQVVSGVAANSVDRVALFTFPNVLSSTSSIDLNCTTAIPSSFTSYVDPSFGPYTMLPFPPSLPLPIPWSGVPTAWPYSSPTAGAASYSGTSEGLISNINGVVVTLATATVTYQLTPFQSDYRTSATATTLNTTSTLVKAAGGVTNCGSMLPPNYDGDFGTNYAGAIYAAQAALTSQQVANPGSSNVIILLSDGNADIAQLSNYLETMPSPANGSGNYPSYVGECGQGIKAAQAATSAGTRFYAVAYGSPSSGCPTDLNAGTSPNISPCNAMASMASATQYFFSDYNQSGSNSTCHASQPVTALSDIFTQIANDLTTARLIPNNTT